jgi:hypothetical protein
MLCPDANPGRRGGKPATNRLSHGTAFLYHYIPSVQRKTKNRMNINSNWGNTQNITFIRLSSVSVCLSIYLSIYLYLRLSINFLW